MKIQAYCPGRVEPEKVVTLRLVESVDRVILAAVDANTGRTVPNGHIAWIDSDGTLNIYKNLNPTTDLQIEGPNSGIVVWT